ncbi:alpha-1,2-fucosyltransferase [Flavobacterium limnophilum]|uniref:alpha-1,2-fucosyltransferase n=1 Tax=Flavobacterium limnophilum TaxID=3003262 RepID=UPI0022ABDC1C|nr:alpha-1,2-fucosyltransferase [Flavobacterium limnophilum]
MIIIRLRGGLGNQMFQYAFGKSIARKLGVDMKLDLTSLLQTHHKATTTNRDYQMNIFNFGDSFLIQPNSIRLLNKLHLNFLIQIIKSIKLIGFKKYKEKTFTAEELIINTPKDKNLYVGYWQSEKYFKNIETELRKDFRFNEELSPQAKSISEAIIKVNAVCVHVRRGDYVANTGSFNCSNLDYFVDGTNYIFKHTNNPHFFVFSDDPEWCKQHLKFDYDFTIVDYTTDKIKYKEDLQLMALCNHFIISASSFSWWAVWLSNKKEAKVVVPKNWFLDKTTDVSDLIHDSWIKL